MIGQDYNITSHTPGVNYLYTGTLILIQPTNNIDFGNEHVFTNVWQIKDRRGHNLIPPQKIDNNVAYNGTPGHNFFSMHSRFDVIRQITRGHSAKGRTRRRTRSKTIKTRSKTIKTRNKTIKKRNKTIKTRNKTIKKRKNKKISI
jgi:hypothetical protein